MGGCRLSTSAGLYYTNKALYGSDCGLSMQLFSTIIAIRKKDLVFSR
jgi:hypothetical protein